MCHTQVKYYLVKLVFVLYISVYVNTVLQCDLFFTVDHSLEFENQCCQDAYVAHREIIAMGRSCIVKK